MAAEAWAAAAIVARTADLAFIANIVVYNLDPIYLYARDSFRMHGMLCT